MSRHQGRKYADLAHLGAIVRQIEPGKTVGIAMANKFVTISAETYPERDDKLTPPDWTKWEDEIGSVPQEEWDRISKLLEKGPTDA